MDEDDIWATARLLMSQHGDAARLAAAQREEAMFEKDDYLGAIAWRRVASAIGELERQKVDQRMKTVLVALCLVATAVSAVFVWAEGGRTVSPADSGAVLPHVQVLRS